MLQFTRILRNSPPVFLLLFLAFLLFTGCGEEKTISSPPGVVEARIVGTWQLESKSLFDTQASMPLDHSRLVLNIQGDGFVIQLDTLDQRDHFYWAVEDDHINFNGNNLFRQADFSYTLNDLHVWVGEDTLRVDYLYRKILM